MNFNSKIVLLIIVLVSGFSTSALAAGNDSHDWSEVISAIIHVESEGNANARNGKYAGALQIAPILVKECNTILEEKKVRKRYTLDDRYDVKKSKEMFRLFQEKYNPEKNIEFAIRAWNGGPKFDKKSTNTYYKKVMEAMRK